MIKLNDHYFIAWLKVVKKFEVSLTNKGTYVFMSQDEYTKSLREYKTIYQPILKEIRKTVKELAIHTNLINT